MRAGALDKLIIIEANTPTRDAYGGLVDSWGTHAKVWAQVIPMSGMEVYRSDQLNTKTTHRVLLRYLSTVTTKMRVNFGGRYFNITGVMHRLEKGDMTELMCEELPDGNRS